jgi:large subunit ribosomal protein L44
VFPPTTVRVASFLGKCDILPKDLPRSTSNPSVLAETGLNTVNPLINIGLFLPSGIKLAEGYGSSFAMAEHRAATNALLSLFLVRGDQPRQIGSIAPLSGQLPSSIHVDFPVDAIGVVRADREVFQGTGFGGLETNEESSKRAAYEGRVKAARKVIPVQA